MSGRRCKTLAFAWSTGREASGVEEKEERGGAREEGGEFFAKTYAIDSRLVTPRCLWRSDSPPTPSWRQLLCSGHVKVAGSLAARPESFFTGSQLTGIGNCIP